MIRISLTFRVLGHPKGQPRVKHFRRGNFIGCYTPDSADAWKEAVHAALITEMQKQGITDAITGPIELITRFFFQRPKSHYKRDGSLKEGAPRWCITKPDFDNVAKAVADTLTNNVKHRHKGIWKDDAQVVLSQQTKEYGAVPGCEIIIRELDEQ